MKPIFLISLALLTALLFACQSKSSTNSATTESPDSSGQPKPVVAAQSMSATNDFLLIPGKRVGPITARSSEASLLSRLGPEVVTVGDTIYGAEGETFTGTTLYKGTADEVQIIYEDNKRTKPQTIIIHPTLLDDDGNPIKNLAAPRWKTADGLQIGTTLNELEQRNGKPFKLWGFGWDYGGAISNWQGGKLAKLTSEKAFLSVRLGPPASLTDDQTEAYEQVSGDGEFVSSSEAMHLLNPIVTIISTELVPE